MPLHRHESTAADDEQLNFRPQFAQHVELEEVPKLAIPRKGMPPATAYQIIHDELMLDGNARLNLATFVTTWMEPEAEKLMAECSSKNMIDKDEYPQTAELERRCVNILAKLWHAPQASAAEEGATGCSTTGSSEACMLGGLALKWRWRQRRGDAAGTPNLVMGSNVQVCWEKFCRYFDVEMRLVPVGPETHLTPEGAAQACDDNTIGVVAVLGSTYDGAYEPVADIAAALDALCASGGPDVPLHVDGASGAMVAPFLDPRLVWDFRIDRVQSINTSGHKYGLVYPGVGWIVWRDAAALPDDLVFKVAYLGGDMPTFALNFSRPGAQVAAQYYNFLRLGHDGYHQVQKACRDNAQWLANQIKQLGPFSLISAAEGIPVFAFRLPDDHPFTVYDVSDALASHGWQVPAYPLPPALEAISVLRIVVRNGFSRDLCRMLLDDIKRVTTALESKVSRPADRTGFHH